jgi:phospholipid/cholesterol/gamma-HCH transport system substrate-binding protein
MPQRKQVQWIQLRVGMMVVTSLVVFGIAIFFISGQVGLFSKKYRLKSYFPDVQGLKVGTPVRLVGFVVGNVEAISIPPYTEPGRAVEVTLRIATEYQSEIRADSKAGLESEGVLGDRFVNVSRGSPQAAILMDGEELAGRPSADMKEIMSNTNDVLSNLRDLSGKLSNITAQVEQGQGSLGRLLSDPSFYNRLRRTAGSAERIVARIEQGEGSMGKLLVDEAFYQKLTSSMDRLDRVLGAIDEGEGTLAQLINDPSIYENLKQFTGQLNTMMAKVNQGEGTVGKLVTDPSLYNQMNHTFQGLGTIAGRIEHGEGTLGRLSTDESLFLNLNTATEELRAFAEDFRRDPKKYLRLRFGLF